MGLSNATKYGLILSVSSEPWASAGGQARPALIESEECHL